MHMPRSTINNGICVSNKANKANKAMSTPSLLRLKQYNTIHKRHPQTDSQLLLLVKKLFECNCHTEHCV